MIARNELINRLSESYSQSKRDNDVVVKLHLFGIKFAEELKAYKPLNKIAKEAGVPESYATELYKAIKLSKYVDIKN